LVRVLGGTGILGASFARDPVIAAKVSCDRRVRVSTLRKRSVRFHVQHGDDRRDTAIIRVLFDTGCRLGELVGLRLGDWDRHEDTLTLTGKTGTRIVSLSPSTGEALARYVRDVRSKHRHHELEDLWIGPKGRLRDSGVAQLLARRCDQADLPRITRTGSGTRSPTSSAPRVGAKAT
jgi:integrase